MNAAQYESGILRCCAHMHARNALQRNTDTTSFFSLHLHIRRSHLPSLYSLVVPFVTSHRIASHYLTLPTLPLLNTVYNFYI